MRTHHGAEPPPSQAERSWAREVRQLSDELQDAERGRPRLLEIAARLQQTRYDGQPAPPLHAPLSAVDATRLNVDARTRTLTITRTRTRARTRTRTRTRSTPWPRGSVRIRRASASSSRCRTSCSTTSQCCSSSTAEPAAPRAPRAARSPRRARAEYVPRRRVGTLVAAWRRPGTDSSAARCAFARGVGLRDWGDGGGGEGSMMEVPASCCLLSALATQALVLRLLSHSGLKKRN